MGIKEILNSKFAQPALILCCDDDTPKLYDCNDKLISELEINIDKADFLKANVRDIFDDAGYEVFINNIKSCMETGRELEFESKCKQILNCCGNDTVFIRSCLVPVDDEDGHKLVYMSIRNITSEKSNLDTLVESERRFKIASEQINIYYWEYTVATKEMRPCFRCMRDLGLPALVKNYPEPAIEAGIFPPDYADMYRDWHRQIHEGVKELEAVIPLTVGRVPFRVKYTTEFDENGKPYKAYGSATLVSQEELDKSRISKSIIEALANTYDMIAMVDFENNKLELIKSVGNGEDFSSTDAFFGALNKYLEQTEASIGDDASKYFDIEFLKKEMFKNTDKREMDFKEKSSGNWIHVIHKVIERDGEEVSKILTSASIMDDLAAARLEDEKIIARQKDELEKRKEQLEEAVDTANRANRAKSDFLARMSHEIRTPMNAIMGMNEIIVKSADDKTIKGYADDAYKAAQGLLGTINEILDFSKIESGKMELVEDEFDLGVFVGNLYNMFALRAEDKNLALVFDVDESLPSRLYGDDNHIRQVLTNLLSNAVKYTQKGTIRFAINKIKSEGEKISLEFVVSDTGRGIKQEDIRKLFAAFERFDLRDNKNIEGTGLGMNIVSGLLGILGSELKVSSKYGEGTTFSFALTLKVINEEPVGDFKLKLDVKEEKKEVKLYENPDKRLLVVDDNAVNIKVFKALLRAMKVQVDTAVSGKAALEFTKDNKYDIIFMDHYMPEMDGIEAFKLIREQEGGANIETPVIALTANAIKGAKEEYISLGFSDAVFKPTTQNVLSDVLWKYLG